MCGIVGYIGCEDSKEILLKGLEKLEYRGYDSSGIAVMNELGVFVFKEEGPILNLRKSMDKNVSAKIGIGHTRWATHGIPNKLNAHPHQSEGGRFTIVHNGIIENYEELKDKYLKNVKLISSTDTEIIVQIINEFVKGGDNVEDAFLKVLKLAKGSYAILMIDSEQKDRIYVGKNKSPLLIGVGNGFNVVTSDAMAMLHVTNEFIEIMDREYITVKSDNVVIKDFNGCVINRASYKSTIDKNDIGKGIYPHYMLKEINEQPDVIRKIVKLYQDEEKKLKIDEDILNAIIESDRIFIIACGTSYHAGLIGKVQIEKYADIPVEVHIASEFGYNTPLLKGNPMFIFITQSGETADCRGPLVKIKEMGYKSLTITNVPLSTLSREADFTLLLHGGPEISVASTKAYTAQITVLTILSMAIRGRKGLNDDFDLVQELGIAANGIGVICSRAEAFEKISYDFLKNARDCFFIGRGYDYYVALEGALKLKEISYIHAEGFAGGELKHGSIALIDDGTPVIAISTQLNTNLNIRGNIKEVTSRKGNVCVISMEGMETDEDTFVFPKVHESLTPLLSVVTLQLISYYAAIYRNCDVDKPRNLAKSVTVE